VGALMGHAPPRPPALPTAESFHLAVARSAFTADRITLEQFERSVEHVLSGGTLNRQGLIGIGKRASC
jgi:hypothetical protein